MSSGFGFVDGERTFGRPPVFVLTGALASMLGGVTLATLLGTIAASRATGVSPTIVVSDACGARAFLGAVEVGLDGCFNTNATAAPIAAKPTRLPSTNARTRRDFEGRWARRGVSPELIA